VNQMICFRECWSPPPHLPKGLIAFGEVGNGDLVCFDYRPKVAKEEPKIVIGIMRLQSLI
jgi:SMI1 / KNR4 family (SUKH-1)